ncbi:MAG: ATP-binding cassette domain-containing protein, partial [Candidatus Odinarchaeota archaeon]
NNFPVQLSTGEKQRVAIARALVNKGSLLLLDEPTGNLDINSGKEFLRILKKIHGQGNTSLIMATHDPEAAKFADRVLLLKQGMIQQL